MAGDLGGSLGPGLVGAISQKAGDSIRSGILAGSFFPLIMIIALVLLGRNEARKQL
jgi:hypothetical protein